MNLLWGNGQLGPNFVTSCMSRSVFGVSFLHLFFRNFFYCMLAFLSDLQLTVQVRIAMVGKYTGLSDSYLSVLKVKLFYQNPLVQPLL